MSSDMLKQIFELKQENIKLKQENKQLKQDNAKLKNAMKKMSHTLSNSYRKIKYLENKLEEQKNENDKYIEEIVSKAINSVTKQLNKEHEKEINELKAQISRLEKRLNTDSSNSGTPTSKDKIGKHKIQNNREKSEKQIGAQKGHQVYKLDYFKDDEITNTIEHTLEACPHCSNKLKETNIVISDIIDIEITITRTRNNIHNYVCTHCKKKVSANNDLPRGVTYGDNIKAIGLSLMNESNTPLNKITSFISGITSNEINLSEGYLIKLQKKSADELDKFHHDLKEKIISLKHVFWDDTTIKFGLGKPSEGYDEKDKEYMEKIENDESKKDKKIRNGVIRFYGDNNWAFLVGHRFKNEEGINNDGILENLGKDCVVMHDHVLLNYNDKYIYKNAECNEHIRRYLKGNMEMFPEHNWAKEMRIFLTELNQEKQKLIENNVNNFSEEKIKEIFDKYDQIIQLGYKENNSVSLTYILNKKEELNLIERLDKFRENHLMFITDFSTNFTNNVSEKGLRQVKRKIAVSFMFKNANRMKDYAIILSYFETCFRNGISRYEASKRLVSGIPYTIAEITNMIEAL